jgi:ATP-dependent helicase/nuclease subunit A
MEWTNEQRLAIEARGGSLVVSAAAGSGKTAVLVERICGLVAEGADLQRMLVATFTRAAAAEMKSRVAARLLEMQAEGKSDVKRLNAQALRIDRASIGTLHSFCGALLREHYNAVGIEPTFKTEEESVTRGLYDEALGETVDSFFEAGDPDFLALADCWGGRDGAGLAELVRKVYGAARNHPDPLGWLDEKVGLFFFEDPARTPWYAELLKGVRDNTALALECINEALRLARLPGGPAQYAECLERERDELAGLAEFTSAGDAEGFGRALGSNAVFGRLPQLRKADEAQKALGARIRERRDEAKKLLKKARENPIVADLAAAAERTRAMGPQMRALHALVAAFDAKYAEEKRYANVLDFSDLEHMALAALRDEGVLEEMRSYYEYVFVDEYQDINPVQDAILNRIARPGRFFCVGDVKQSIYRFRSAEPEIFTRRLARASADGDAPERRVGLSSNFRSSRRVVGLVNYAFRNLMSAKLGGVAYEGSERLAHAAPRPPVEMRDGANEFILIDNGGRQEEELTRLQELVQNEREASVVARRIEEIVGGDIWDGKAGAFRKACYSDVAVLLRTVSGVAADYAEVFRRAGIPVYAEAESGFADEIEVRLLMNALRLVDNAYRDFELITSLYSQIGGFSLADLVEIRGLYPDGSFAEAAYKYAEENGDDLAARLNAFLARVDVWRALARHSDVEKLIFRICDDTGFLDYAATLPGGEQRRANVLRLAGLARGYAGGLFGFVRDFDKLAEAGAGGGRIGRPAGAVTIMSVHKAKGLEFPVVILANVGKRINLQDAGEHMLTHGELGLGPRYFNAARRTKADTLARSALLGRAVRDTLSEEMRMLYVALTRARERVVVVGTVSDLAGRLGRWSLPLTAAGLLSRAACWADWLGPVALQTRRGREAFVGFGAEAGILPDAPDDWVISLVDAADIESPRPARTGRREALAALAEEALKTEIPMDTALALLWRYPWGDVSALPAKVSATSLLDHKRNWRGPIPAPEIRRKPRFMEDAKTFTAADLGTFAHAALQLLPADVPPEDIEQEIKKLEERGLLPQGAAAAIDAGWIARFHRSGIAARMRRSGAVHRELPFNLSAPVSAIFPGETGGDEVLVQGIIDCCFIEDGKWVLLDYKTNRVDAAHTAAQIAEYYRPQILTYKAALEAITGIEVREAYLYLLAVGEEVKIRI